MTQAHRYQLLCPKCKYDEFHIDTLGDPKLQDSNLLTIECLQCNNRFDYEQAEVKDLGVA